MAGIKLVWMTFSNGSMQVVTNVGSGACRRLFAGQPMGDSRVRFRFRIWWPVSPAQSSTRSPTSPLSYR